MRNRSWQSVSCPHGTRAISGCRANGLTQRNASLPSLPIIGEDKRLSSRQRTSHVGSNGNDGNCPNISRCHCHSTHRIHGNPRSSVALGVFYYGNFTDLARLFRCLGGRWRLCAVDEVFASTRCTRSGGNPAIFRIGWGARAIRDRLEPRNELQTGAGSLRRGRGNEFLEARIIPQWIEHRIEPEKRRSERHACCQRSIVACGKQFL